MKTIEIGNEQYLLRFDCGADDFYYSQSGGLFAAEVFKAALDKPWVNSIVLYGPSGCGKTHLVKGFFGDYRRLHPEHQAVMMTTECFVLEMIQAIKDKRQDAFTEKYSCYQLLILDDAFYLKGKAHTQREIGEVFKRIAASGGISAVVFDEEVSSAYKELWCSIKCGIDNGIACDLPLPDAGCRMEYARNFAKTMSPKIPESVAESFAEERQTVCQIRSAMWKYSLEKKGNV